MPYQCPTCKQIFETKKQLAPHKFKCHNPHTDGRLIQVPGESGGDAQAPPESVCIQAPGPGETSQARVNPATLDILGMVQLMLDESEEEKGGEEDTDGDDPPPNDLSDEQPPESPGVDHQEEQMRTGHRRVEVPSVIDPPPRQWCSTCSQTTASTKTLCGRPPGARRESDGWAIPLV